MIFRPFNIVFRSAIHNLKLLKSVRQSRLEYLFMTETERRHDPPKKKGSKVHNNSVRFLCVFIFVITITLFYMQRSIFSTHITNIIK